MCGICGVVDFHGARIPAKDLQEMTGVLRHRGPDDEGTAQFGPVALGFRRLSILDLTRGHQPMCNEDRTVWIAFNGEIYNHAELRPLLEERGHRYATKSDTETIVHLYEEFGDDCVNHLRGMFAFAIWDAPRKRLFCARDRMGIKPFYYARIGGRFVFASEIKALFAHPGLKPRLNRRALPEFLAFGYISSEETLFEGVYKLPPAHRLTINLDAGVRSREPRVTEYWDLRIGSQKNAASESEATAQFQELFRATVRSHLMSDVPVGVFLSGGLDSSAIAAEMAALRSQPIQTFSVGYAEDEYSELPFARQVAKHIGAEHNEVILTARDFFASLPKLIWQEDEPLVWPSSVSLFHVSRLASEKVKVVLSGEGGDEIFAGYLKYRVTLWNLAGGPLYRRAVPQRLQNVVRRALDAAWLPDWTRRKLRHSFLYYPEAFEQLYFDNFYSVFPQGEQPNLLTREVSDELAGVSAYANSLKFLPRNGTSASQLDRLLYLDLKTYLVELLMKQDQMSMATSLESRVPFLDHKVVEFAASLPARYKVRGVSGKRLLRRAMAGRLPAEVLSRHKKGFPTPVRPWLRNQLLDPLTAVLTDGRMAARGVIRPDYVTRLLHAHRRGDSSATEGCWRLLNFELWSRVFLDGERREAEAAAVPAGRAFACA